MKSILFSLSVFLNLFQLIFSISERAIHALLGLLRLLIGHICQFSLPNTLVHHLHHSLPKSIATLRKISALDSDITEYVVCPRRFSLYDYASCIIKRGSVEESKRCEYQEYPNHPQPSRRRKCNTVLLKRIKISNRSKLAARKVYVYKSVIKKFTELLC